MNAEHDRKRERSGDATDRLNENIAEAARRLEQESERVIAYLNDEVVPAIRHGSSKALRVAAQKLSRLAEYMEQNRSR
jgi:F0F1-type ATP synthase membrane subunit b/b'